MFSYPSKYLMFWGRGLGPGEGKAGRNEERCQLGYGGCHEEEFLTWGTERRENTLTREADNKEGQRLQTRTGVQCGWRGDNIEGA